MVAFTSEPSSIYRCLHVQHTQQTGELPPLSTSVIITASSLLREKEKSEISSASSLLHHYWYNLWKKGSLGFKALLQIQKEIKSGYCTIQGMHSEIKAGQADRQESDPPQDTSLPSCTHTEARTAPGSVPQTMQMGNGPIPFSKAKEASFEISGVPKS